MSSDADLLRRVYGAALGGVRARLDVEVPRALADVPDLVGPEGQVVLIAFGKAARPMATRALEALGSVSDRVRGLLVPPNDDDAPLAPLEVVAAGHPLPDEQSFRAAQRALALARDAGPDDVVVFLVSGGGSALLELPIDPDVSLGAWRAFQQALVASGASIDRVNAVRMQLSAVKGGRLGAAAGGARDVRTLYVSDVPGEPETIASGPTARCGHLLREPLLAQLRALDVLDALPERLRARALAGEVPPLPRDDHVPGDMVRIADEGDCRRRAAEVLAAEGVVVDADLDIDDLPHELAATRALQRLDELGRAHPDVAVAVVTTGELSVPLPATVGVGGRNLHFALACVARIAGVGVTVLSGGTDGVDGNAPAAGAVVDGRTAARAGEAGLDLQAHLRGFDAYPALQRLGATLEPGATGVNVRDLRVLLRRPG